MHVSLIWAMSENGVIGRDNTLPWRLPDDLKHFMRTTLGHPVLMGRRTFESMKAPLPGRTNVVMTANCGYADLVPDGVLVVHSFDEGVALASAIAAQDGKDQFFVTGGVAAYRLGLLVATRLMVTRVHAQVTGDTVFPDIDWSQWQRVASEEHAADKINQHAFAIETYERVEVS